MGYGERLDGEYCLRRPLVAINEQYYWGKEFLYIEINPKEHTLTLQRDALCILPIFLAEDSRHIVLHSDFACAVASLNQKELVADRLCVIQYLIGSWTHRRTLIQQVQTIYDRARIEIKGMELRIINPPDSCIGTLLKKRTSNPYEFRARLDAVLEIYKKRYAPSNKIQCMLSGGCDSSTIAGYYAHTGMKVHGVTLGYPGSFRESQQSKLRDLEATFGVRSVTYPLRSYADYPFAHAAHIPNWKPFYHRIDPYSRTINDILYHGTEEGLTVQFNGLGGDELFENVRLKHLRSKSDEVQLDGLLPTFTTACFRRMFQASKAALLQEYTPIPLQAYSMTNYGACMTNGYFDYNIWPVAPLGDPELYAYCQGLPAVYKKNKTILRAYLEAAGFPKSVYQPKHNEHFLPFLQAASRNKLAPHLKRLLNSSVLAESGLIRPAQVVEQLDKPDTDQALVATLLLLVVEANLQALHITSF